MASEQPAAAGPDPQPPEPAVFQPWRLQWRTEQIVRYWNWWSSNPALQHLYFSKASGDALLDEVARTIPFKGTLLDVGCGPGHLVEKALARGMRVLASDSSPGSVETLNRRLGARPGFAGARASQGLDVPYEDAVADVVTVIETVEHLDDQALDVVLREAYRLTRPGGHVVVTTPNDEDLRQLEVMCPHCACVYHQFQHVRSFTPAALRAQMEQRGFQTVRCEALLLSFLPAWMRPFHRWAHPRVKGKLPHMLYVGRRS